MNEFNAYASIKQMNYVTFVGSLDTVIEKCGSNSNAICRRKISQFEKSAAAFVLQQYLKQYDENIN